MLDADTKRNIDTARDILVGKVPDPKSQVEQITIALIYKFMDDMDRESIGMGGKASFFTGAYKRYGWSKIFDPRIGGLEMLALYSEAITKLDQNPAIPQLFRDIFKNAYLPYRDPETLKLFLKTINEFSYDHSEKLGDAFEYLLSVLGSQGDAGQFRTPRHIIDFMVEAADPKKHETIIDPACGTAGFLVSSYKHIIRANTVRQSGDQLGPAERKKLLGNFKGYDISPDMVRLSLANLYLHGFVQPQIYEYDTLTSEDRWNEYADVILANPPFMSPKGGIIPHKRFSVQSKRSEALFVDYIAEHLTPTGRAAVIVPEGIIFQSAKAYTQLRKVLVEKYLYAVVSLPAGVFNPYSGVKTSILLMNRQIAAKAHGILFIKVENDGFDLGAQRRAIDRNDLPAALKAIKEFQKTIINRKVEEVKKVNKGNTAANALIVPKETLAENGEYNLTGDRYRVVERRGKQKWPMVKIGDVCTLGRGRVINKQEIEKNPGMFPVYSSQTMDNGILGFLNTYDFEGECVTWTTDGANAGTVFYRNGKFNCTNVCGILRLKPTEKNINIKYLALVLNTTAYKYVIKVGNPKLMNKEMARVQIPLPPFEIQQEIITEIEGYQRVIDGAQQMADNWKPQIEVDPQWPVVKLGDVCSLITDTIEPHNHQGTVEYIGLENIESNSGKLIGKTLTSYTQIKSLKNIFSRHDILYGKLRPNLNKVYFAQFSGICSTDIIVLRAKEIILPALLEIYLRSDVLNREIVKGVIGAQLPRVKFEHMANLTIPLPPLAIQQEIVANIESERKIIDGCRELIVKYEEKIKKIVDGVWEE
jgi:type I restriction enzyme M protein